MDNLTVKADKTTPEINFYAESGKLSISGESYPENAISFYKPVVDWIKKYIEEKRGKIEMTFNMIYFNTSSSKAVLDILDILEEYFQNGGDATVFWRFEKDDEDIEESGEEFAEGLTLPFKMVPY